MNEIDKFFSELPTEDKDAQDVFNDKGGESAEVKVPEKEVGEGDGTPENRKNRRHRRLEEQLQRERESNIALNERVRVLAELKSQEVAQPGAMPTEWVALYGDTPEAKTAWALQEKMFNNAKESAKKEAIAEFQEQQANIIKQQKEFETLIDSELEALEEDFDVDLTSSAPAARKARREFLELVQKVSPKDENGNVTSYADFNSTFELYKNSRPTSKTTDTVQQKKDLAAKSMQQSAGTNDGSAGTDAELAWLRSQGIRV